LIYWIILKFPTSGTLHLILWTGDVSDLISHLGKNELEALFAKRMTTSREEMRCVIGIIELLCANRAL
jgi:hypothetical protein